MPNYEGIAFKVIISKNFDGVVFKTVMLSGAKIMDSQINAESTWSSEHLAKLFPKGEASGSIATFDDGAGDVPLISCVADFMATQASGTPTPSSPIPIVGVDKVNVIRTGKNLLNVGTQEVTGTYKAIELDAPIPAGTYILSANISSTYTTVAARFRKADASALVAVTLSPASPNRSSVSVTLPEPAYYIYLYSANGQSGYTATWTDVQLEEGSTATTYEPYNGTTALINLGGTYYGGSVDAVTGKITLTHKIAQITAVGDKNGTWDGEKGAFWYCTTYQSNWLNEWDNSAVNNGIKVDQFSLQVNVTNNTNTNAMAVFTSKIIRWVDTNRMTITKEDYNAYLASNPITILYPLATPIVVYASNTAEIPTIVGDNQVYANTGDVAVKYFLDIKKYIDNLVNPSNTRTLSTGLNLTREAPSMPDEAEEEEESQETNEER